MRVDHPIISADSHITEAPNTYIDYIDPAYRDIAPQVVSTEDKGDVYVIDGMRRSIPMGLVAAAGKPAEELDATGPLRGPPPQRLRLQLPPRGPAPRRRSAPS